MQQLQRALYRAANQSSRRRFHAPSDKVSRPDVLSRARADVKANKSAAGVHDVSIADIEARGVAGFLKKLRA